MANHHDHSYKLLFSHAEMIRDLLTGFVKEAWVKQLDLSTLEKVGSSYVTDDLRNREDDVIWRVRWGDDFLYIYLLIEFQSSIDKYMAVRIMTYLGLLYQDLVHQRALPSNGKLPPVLPIVLYNGEQRWSAAQNVAELVEQVPGGLEHYCPTLHYLLLDQGEIAEDMQLSTQARNAVAAVFRLENHRSHEEILETVTLLLEWLKAPEQLQLRRHFALWLKRVLLRQWAPDNERGELDALIELEEVQNMLAERAKQWPERWKQEGLEEGLEKGREEGREEGIEKGLEKGRAETARNLIQFTQLDDATIAKTTGLSEDEVRKLRAQH